MLVWLHSVIATSLLIVACYPNKLPILKVPRFTVDHQLCWLRSLSPKEENILRESCRSEENDDHALEIDFPAAERSQVKTRLCHLLVEERPEREKYPCWGYEADADEHCLLCRPECPQRAESWAPNKIEQLKMFFESADFGYVRERRSELEHYCHPLNSSNQNSELKCTSFLRYCTGRNLYLDLRRLDRVPEPIRYREDVLQQGDIGGWNCSFDRAKLTTQGDHKSPLMSWFAEIANFQVANASSVQCDVTLDKPTYIMKLDATINMYHHFCDFLNLYISMHLASDSSFFHRDNHIILWDSIPYRSNFAPVWSAFTRNPILTISDFRGKRLCFRDVTFPLLPRMIFGMYYNMPLVPGCQQSGLFRAFNRHLLVHLNLSTTEDLITRQKDEVIQVTFIARSTKHRKVLNQNQLVAALREAVVNRSTTFNGRHRLVQISLVDLNHRMPFFEQVNLTSRSDVLIGMHGAGLTHTLLQPDYGVLLELYNCQDTECYRDLARLRGTHYLTWRSDSKIVVVPTEDDRSQNVDRAKLGAAHAKFVNYRFDVEEFVQLALEAIEQAVKRKENFITEFKSKWWWRGKISDTQTRPQKTEL